MRNHARNTGSPIEAASALAEDMGDLVMAVAEQEADVVAGLVERQADEMSGLAEAGAPGGLLEDLAAHHRKVLEAVQERERERVGKAPPSPEAGLPG